MKNGEHKKEQMEEGKEVNQLISIKETELEILDRMKKEEIGLIRMKLLI